MNKKIPVEVYRNSDAYGGGLIFIKKGCDKKPWFPSEYLGLFRLPQSFLDVLNKYKDEDVWDETYWE